VIGFSVHEFEQNINTIRYYPASYPRARCIDWKPDLISLNIFEFAYMCKAWALKNGFSLLSGFNKEKKSQTCFINLGYDTSGDCVDVWWDEDFKAPTEEETIFLACEFILKKNELIFFKDSFISNYKNKRI